MSEFDGIDGIRTGMLVVLFAYLCFSITRRRRRAEAEYRAREWARKEAGVGFDTSAIAPQIRRVREDYVAGSHGSGQGNVQRAGLVAAARGVISEFAWFRRKEDEGEESQNES